MLKCNNWLMTTLIIIAKAHDYDYAEMIGAGIIADLF